MAKHKKRAKRSKKPGRWTKTHGAATKREMEYLWRVAQEKNRDVLYDPS